jgi:hypothetical protein
MMLVLLQTTATHSTIQRFDCDDCGQKLLQPIIELNNDVSCCRVLTACVHQCYTLLLVILVVIVMV